MIEQKEHFHGSDLEKIEKIYGIKKENIVSFAANVNPLGESGKLKTALSERIDAITKYPDREYTSLRKAIGSYCKCDYNHITVGTDARSSSHFSFRLQLLKRHFCLVRLTLSTSVI